MGARGTHSSRTALATTLPLILLATLALGACGSSGTTGPPELSSGPPGASPSPAITVTDTEGTVPTSAGADGWEFKPRVDIEVTALGYYDGTGDGLRNAHKVGIFESCGVVPGASLPVGGGRFTLVG